jgi:hypothetical protein
LEVEIATEKPKSYISPRIDQTAVELIQAVGNGLHYEIHKLISARCNKEEFPKE